MKWRWGIPNKSLSQSNNNDDGICLNEINTRSLRLADWEELFRQYLISEQIEMNKIKNGHHYLFVRCRRIQTQFKLDSVNCQFDCFFVRLIRCTIVWGVCVEMLSNDIYFDYAMKSNCAWNWIYWILLFAILTKSNRLSNGLMNNKSSAVISEFTMVINFERNGNNSNFDWQPTVEISRKIGRFWSSLFQITLSKYLDEMLNVERWTLNAKC